MMAKELYYKLVMGMVEFSIKISYIDLCVDRGVDAEVNSADVIICFIDFGYNMGSSDVFSDGSNYVQTCGFYNRWTTWI